jgi:hypothetical protein
MFPWSRFRHLKDHMFHKTVQATAAAPLDMQTFKPVPKYQQMNVFVAQHPMTDRETGPHPRLRRLFQLGLLVYSTWLLLLGPFWALDGRGMVDFIPWGVQQYVYLPAIPVFHRRALSPVFEPYLNWWYSDPNPAETTG